MAISSTFLTGNALLLAETFLKLDQPLATMATIGVLVLGLLAWTAQSTRADEVPPNEP